MAYLRKLSPLEDMATSQLAINLCQDNSFKEVAMCLEQPISDLAVPRNIVVWDAAIDKQCQRLTEGLPHSVKHGIHVWISRIVLQYASFSQRMELLFKIPRYFFMNFLTQQDWIENGRINEKRVAKRLLKDERLTTLQRYHIACTYCLHKSIPLLWHSLMPEEKQFIHGYEDSCNSKERNSFVVLWLYFMDGHREKKKHLWTNAARLAVLYGNQASLMQCWKRLNKEARKRIIMPCALQSLEKWERIRSKDSWREKLVSNEYCNPHRRSKSIECFNLPYYYSELLRFFLSQMSKRQQLKFFETVLQNQRLTLNSGYLRFPILRCFVEWPLLDDLLPTMNRLWGILPKDIYGLCLLSLAEKYTQAYDRLSSSVTFYKIEELYYDYRSLLWNLWVKTPEDYKQYVFSDEGLEQWGRYRKTVIEHLLRQLPTRSPLQEKDVALFKRVWRDVPQEKRKEVMYDKDRKSVCLTLVEKEMWSLLSSLLEECLPKEEIPSFKLKFTESSIIHINWLNKLEKNCEKYVEGFIDWAFVSDIDILKFKDEIIKTYGVSHCSDLLIEEKYADMERIINFCLPSDEMKLQFKVDVVKETCRGFLQDCAWEQMDKSIAWIFEDEEKITSFKKDLFDSVRVTGLFYIHHGLVFNPSPQWEKVERFYRWFCLSPEEIKKLKKETAFSSKVISTVHSRICGTVDKFYERFYGKFHVFVRSLCWCLTDEEMVINFKEIIENFFFEQKRTKRIANAKMGKERLDYLVRELFQSFQKEIVHDKINAEDNFMKDKGKKRSSVDDDDSSSTKKRF